MNLCRDSLKLGPESMELSGFWELFGWFSGSLLYDTFDLNKEFWGDIAFTWGDAVYT